MHRIRVDTDVYTALANLAVDPFTDTPNRVLRRFFGMNDPGPDRTTTAKGLDPRLEPLIDAGLLAPGQQLTWDRPRLRVRHTVTVTDDGQVRLPDGTTYPSPHQAAKHLAGYPADGYAAFTTADGTTLATLSNRVAAVPEDAGPDPCGAAAPTGTPTPIAERAHSPRQELDS